MVDLVLLKVIFYCWPFLRTFWGLFFIFSRVLKQIQVSGVIVVATKRRSMSAHVSFQPVDS